MGPIFLEFSMYMKTRLFVAVFVHLRLSVGRHPVVCPRNFFGFSSTFFHHSCIFLIESGKSNLVFFFLIMFTLLLRTRENDIMKKKKKKGLKYPS